MQDGLQVVARSVDLGLGCVGLNQRPGRFQHMGMLRTRLCRRASAHNWPPAHRRHAVRLRSPNRPRVQLQGQDGIPGGAVAEPVASRAVESQDTAHRRDVKGGGIGSIDPAPLGEKPIQPGTNHTRLDADRLVVAGQDATHRVREVDDQPRSNRLARQPAARSARATGSRSPPRTASQGTTSSSERVIYRRAAESNTLASDADIWTNTSSQNTSPSSNPQVGLDPFSLLVPWAVVFTKATPDQPPLTGGKPANSASGGTGESSVT